MARLIDADGCPCIKCDRLGNCRPGLCEAFAEWWLSPMDAVKVVRCKDCKYCYKSSGSSTMCVGVIMCEDCFAKDNCPVDKGVTWEEWLKQPAEDDC